MGHTVFDFGAICIARLGTRIFAGLRCNRAFVAAGASNYGSSTFRTGPRLWQVATVEPRQPRVCSLQRRSVS